MFQRKVFFPFVLITLATLFLNISLQMSLPSFSLYLKFLNFPIENIGMVSLLVALAGMFFRPVSAYLNHKIGPVYTALLGSGLYFVAFAILSITAYIPLVVGARILQGIGMGIGITVLGSMIAQIIPHDELLKGMNIYSLFASSANSIGPYIGMFLVLGNTFSRLFLTGLMFVVLGILTLIILKIKSDVVIETVEHKELVKISLFKSPAFIPSLVGLLTALVYSSIVSYLSLYALEIGLDNIGFFFLLNFVGLVLSRFAIQPLVVRFSLIALMPMLGLFYAIVLLSLTWFHSVFAWSILAVAFGFVFNIVFTLINTLAIKNVSIQDKAIANAMMFFLLDFGFFSGGVLWGQIAKHLSLSSIFVVAAGVIFLDLSIGGWIFARNKIEF